MLGLDGLSPVIRGGFFDRSIIEEYQLSTSNRLRRWQSRASGSRNSSNMVGKLGRSSVVAGRATCTTGSAPASAPATDSINRSYRFSPTVSLLLSRCQRRSPQPLRSLSFLLLLYLSCFFFFLPLFVSSSRYRYVTKEGKKETIWKRSGTNQASIVKSGIEGANYYEGEEKKEANKRDNETSDGNPRRLAIYLFRRAPRFPFMTTVKFTPRVNNELNPFFSSFQQATNPRI